MRKCRIGVLGTGRGKAMMRFCANTDVAELVAVCDNQSSGIEQVKALFGAEGIAFYSSFDEFLEHDMDLVMLANYANEHAPFAIRAMEAGKAVVSEVVPVQNMAEAVALIECIERTGQKYCFAENYCFLAAPYEMKKRFDAGQFGTFEYGEGEYMHNCEPIWPKLAHGDPQHWRNIISAFFYCTHSVGPLLHISGQRPKRVSGFEMPFNERMGRMGAKAGGAAIEMVTLENGALIKSLHGLGCSRSSTWFTVYGSEGRMESAREDTQQNGINRIYVNHGEDLEQPAQSYIPDPVMKIPKTFPGGPDFTDPHNAVDDYVCLSNVARYVMGDEKAEVIGVYEALNMWMCGFFGHLSCLEGGVPKEIPDLRDPSVREKFRNDRRCTDPKAAGEQLLPSCFGGTPVIPDSVYETQRQAWEDYQRENC